MKKIDPIIIGIIIITIVISGGIILASTLTQESSISQYQVNDVSRPQMVINEINFDFGQMALKETKIKEIPIINIGQEPLILSDFATSCDCTFIQVIINNQESPKFTMHRNPNWRGELKTNKTAMLKIIYEPKIMPVKGLVKREVVFKTNDPLNPLINIQFTAQVE